MTGDIPIDIPKLRRRVVVRFSLAIAIIGAVLFIPAGTVAWWQAWTWMATWMIPALLFTKRYLRRDPEMIARRIQSREPEKVQRWIIRAGIVIFALTFLIPGFDRRFGWSTISSTLNVYNIFIFKRVNLIF